MLKQYILPLVFFSILLSLSTPAYAYLDPGTGSVLVQGLLAGAVSALAVLKLYWQRIKRFFGSRSKKPVDPHSSVRSKNDDSQQ